MTDRKPYSGQGSRGSADNIAARDAYEKNSRTKAVGRFMRTFSRTKTSPLVTAWNSAGYLTIKGTHPVFIADVSSAVDSATVGSTGWLALLDKAWEIFYTNANLKDLESAEEDAWKLYFCAMMQICASLQIQYNFRTLLPAYTESDTTPGSSTQIPYFTQSSFDIFLASMKNYPVPKGIYELVNAWFGWIVQLADEYEQFSLRIPPCYFAPFNDYYDLADLEALREICRVNLGNMTTHAKKFGLKTGSWTDPKSPTIKKPDDVDFIAYCNHAMIVWYDNTPAADVANPNGGFMGANRTSNFTSVEYCFKDTPNESIFHLFAELFGYTQGANAVYAGIFVPGGVNAAEYTTDLLDVAEHGTAVSSMLLGELPCVVINSLFKAFHDSNSAIFQVSLGGTNFTAAQLMDGVWPFAVANNCYIGSGRGADETENDIVNYFGKLLV